MITKLSTLRKMWVPTGFVPYMLKHFIAQQLGITKCMVLHSCQASAKETHLIIFFYTCMWALLEMSKKNKDIMALFHFAKLETKYFNTRSRRISHDPSQTCTYHT